MRPAYEEGVAARRRRENECESFRERAELPKGPLPFARVRDLAREDNPYPASSYTARMWRRGFLAGPEQKP